MVFYLYIISYKKTTVKCNSAHAKDFAGGGIGARHLNAAAAAGGTAMAMAMVRYRSIKVDFQPPVHQVETSTEVD